MRADSIIHMETNKENTVSLTEGRVCAAPASTSPPVGRQPAVSWATCHPPPPSMPSREKAPRGQASPQPAGLTRLMWIKVRALGFLCCRRVPDYTPAWQTHTPPHPITSLKTPRVSAHTFFASYQSTSQLLWFEYEGPSEEKRASGTRLRGWGNVLNCSCHGNVLKQD